MFYIDTREVDKHLLHYAVERGWISKSLPAGDFRTPHLVIERKTYKDLFDSIRKPRFLAQVRKILDYAKTHSKTVMYIIEGDIQDTAKVIRKEKGMKYNFANINEVRASVLDLTIAFGIPVFFTKDQLDTMRLLTQYADRGKKAEHKPYHIPPRKIPQHLIDIVRTLMSINGIGEQSAKDIATQMKASHIRDLLVPKQTYIDAGVKKRSITMLNNNEAFRIENNL